MTISEMYQEIVDQDTTDIFLDEDGYIIDDYAIDDIMNIEYDAEKLFTFDESWSKNIDDTLEKIRKQLLLVYYFLKFSLIYFYEYL